VMLEESKRGFDSLQPHVFSVDKNNKSNSGSIGPRTPTPGPSYLRLLHGKYIRLHGGIPSSRTIDVQRLAVTVSP